MNTIGEKIQEVAKKLQGTIQLFSEVAECPGCNVFGDSRSKCKVHGLTQNIEPLAAISDPTDQ